MEHLLLESAVRATLIAAGMGVVLWAFGIRKAAARHRAWTGVVILMLLLPAWTSIGPKVSFRVMRPVAADTERPAFPASRGLAVRGTPPQAAGAISDTARTRESAKGLDWQILSLGIYLVGACTLLGRLALGTVRARRLIRTAVMQEGVRTSASCASPITVGSLRPVVILPKTWQRWP